MFLPFSHSGKGQHVDGLLPQSCLGVVESQFVVVVDVVVHHLHHLMQHLFVLCQQTLLVEDAVVEAVEFQ